MSRSLGWFEGLALACWAYLIVRPISNNRILILVFALLGLVALGSLLVRGWRVRSELAPLLLIEALFAAFGLSIGAIHNQPGVVQQIPVFVLAPAVYWLMLSASDEWTLRRFLSVTAWVSAVSATILIVFIVDPDRIPSPLVRFFDLAYSNGLGYEHTHSFGLDTIIVTGPLWIASFFVRDDHGRFPSKYIRLYCVATSITVAFLSGQRVLLVCVIAAPFLALALKHFLVGNAIRSRHRAAGAALVVLVLGGLALGTATDVGPFAKIRFAVDTAGAAFFSGQSIETLNAGNVNNATSAAGSLAAFDGGVRSAEAEELLQGFYSEPIAGAGLGAVLPNGYARDITKQWDFELQYHMLLFDTGITGGAMIVAALAVGWRRLRRAVRQRPDLAAALIVSTVGMLALAIANASDPYLQAPAFMWGLFLPLAWMNLAFTPQHSFVASSGQTGRAMAGEWGSRGDDYRILV